MVMLSLVLLSGYAGQIALCQFTFAGIGALVMGKLFPGGQLFGLLVVFVFTALVGALVALPALRLQDLYLGLVTFSVALFADKIVFDHPRTYDNGGNLFFDRVAIGPVELTSDRARFMVAVAGFALFAVLVLAIRRGRFGRMLAAMSDSPAAAATLGMSILRTKMAVFALSGGMAGVAGALFGVTRGSAGAVDFDTIRSLYIYLLATIGGITTVTGAFIGGVVSTGLPIIQEEWIPQIQLTGLFIGIGAIVVSRSPNGLAGLVLTQIERLRRRRVDPAATAEPAAPVAPVATEAA
jgi:branched-chain amino acid transport system permease protein